MAQSTFIPQSVICQSPKPDVPSHIVQIGGLGKWKKLQEKSEAAMRTASSRAFKRAPTWGVWPLDPKSIPFISNSIHFNIIRRGKGCVFCDDLKVETCLLARPHMPLESTYPRIIFPSCNLDFFHLFRKHKLQYESHWRNHQNSVVSC